MSSGSFMCRSQWVCRSDWLGTNCLPTKWTFTFGFFTL